MTLQFKDHFLGNASSRYKETSLQQNDDHVPVAAEVPVMPLCRLLLASFPGYMD